MDLGGVEGPPQLIINAPNARQMLPEEGFEAHDAALREARQYARNGGMSTAGYQRGTILEGDEAQKVARAMGLPKDVDVREIHLSASGDGVRFALNQNTSPEALQKFTDAATHKAAIAKVIPLEAMPALAREGAITQQKILIGDNPLGRSTTLIEVPHTATTTGAGFALYVDDRTGHVTLSVVGNDRAQKSALALNELEINTQRAAATALGFSSDEIDRQLYNQRGGVAVEFRTSKSLEEVSEALTRGGVVGKHYFVGLEAAVVEHQALVSNAPKEGPKPSPGGGGAAPSAPAGGPSSSSTVQAIGTPSAQTPPTGTMVGAQASASGHSAPAAGPDASNSSSFKMGRTELLDQGALAVNYQSLPSQPAPPQPQLTETTHVGAGRGPAANEVTPQLQSGETGNVGAGRAAPSDDVSLSNNASPPSTQEKPGATSKLSPTTKVVGKAAGVTVFTAGAISAAHGVYAAGKSLHAGESLGEAARKAGTAALDSAPVIGAARQGRTAEAVMQGFSGLLLGTALAAAPVSLGTSLAAAVAIDDAARKAAQKMGFNVDDGLLTAIAIAAPQAIEKTIPAAVMQANTNMLRTQENLMKDAGMGDKDASGKTGADYLRDPQTREAYLTTLRGALKTEKHPKAHEAIALMVESADKFVEIEGRRTAKLQPFMKEAEAKLIATLKAQHVEAPSVDISPMKGPLATLTTPPPSASKGTPVASIQMTALEPPDHKVAAPSGPATRPPARPSPP
jgi:hypothetical protein